MDIQAFEAHSRWLDSVTSLDSFLTADIVPREPLIEGLLLSQSLVMIYAKRGAGKTRFAASLAIALAKGDDFLFWHASKPRRVLFVDGELAATDLQRIFKDFAGSESIPNLQLISSETFAAKYGCSLNVASKEDQDQFFKLLEDLKRLERAPEVIILDNNSSLTGALDENDNSKQETFLSFLRQLRHSGYTVILVHHAGKSGEQRGASRREDFLDLCLKLEEKPSLDGSAAFKVHITKKRWLVSKTTFECRLMPSPTEKGKVTWIVRDVEYQKPGGYKDQSIELLTWIHHHKPDTQAEITEKLKISRSTISREIGKLRENGYLEGQGFALTERGVKYISGEFE